MEKTRNRLCSPALARLLLLTAVLFSYAMFQGGFVSWFLFYSFLPFGLYGVFIAIYPLGRAAVRRTVPAGRRYWAGDRIPVTAHIDLPWPIPLAAVAVAEGKQDGGAMLAWPLRRRLVCTWSLSLPRGRHSLDTIRLEVSDAFGWVHKTASFHAPCTVIVYPRYIEWPAEAVREWFAHGKAARPIPLHRDMAVAAGAREYAPGDKMSWVHWKASARRQELMTKEFDEQRNDDWIVVLDGAPSRSFEELVTLAASVAKALIDEGVPVGLLVAGKERSFVKPRRHDEQWQSLLLKLAEANDDRNEPLARVMSEEINGRTAAGCIMVTSSLSAEWVGQLREMASKRRVVLYVVSDKWGDDEQNAADRLRHSGVYVSHIAPHTLQTVWQGGKEK
ncbi:DUF58 domain-containing protein [Anoxybacillus geothermalis]|nr:cytosolic protein [Geobacillus stearothermophilus]KFX34847.1 cytosolic protein [Geobacillus stearothermophilus]KZM52850.1 cytosolic protein [Geobacillus stearothermophilus]MED0654554.1 DUF58 domain-containing protein [Anoxybacillus geothermalis]WJQ14319.1 DUF58 domain-containing protein [Geobacillus stearothermophilus]